MPVGRVRHTEYMRTRWYPNNVKRHVETVKRGRQKLYEKLIVLKDNPCTDCGNKYPHYVMDFDHVKGGKVRNVSTLAHAGATKLLEAELEKCELVCANCHRERTWKRSHNEH